MLCFRLTEKLLSEQPTLRKDQGMTRAYMFLLDFLEVVSKETAKTLKENQSHMRSLLEAAKVSESELDRHIHENCEKVPKAFKSTHFSLL
jgi:ubiquitin C-terminal hydrolase